MCNNCDVIKTRKTSRSSLERIMNNRLRWYLKESNNLLHRSQEAGFREKCSTTDHIINLESIIVDGFNQKLDTYPIFLDLSKAFPSVWITGHLYKLSQLNIEGPFLLWFDNFLRSRSIRVQVYSFISEPRNQRKGFPQGTVTSPLLYNIMTADFPKFTSLTKSLQFANGITQEKKEWFLTVAIY